MRNQNTHWAWGATAFVAFGDKADGFGIRPRVRLWLSRTVSLDLGPGFVEHVHAGGTGAGFAGEAAVNVGDWFALAVQTLKVRPPTPTSTGGMAWYGGARLGSYLGLAAAVAAGVVGVVIALSCGGGNCS